VTRRRRSGLIAPLEDFLADKLVLLTPTLFDFEISNAMRVAVTR
jgi:hypothetical protein